MACANGKCKCKLTALDLQNAGVYVIANHSKGCYQVGIPRTPVSDPDPVNDVLIDVWGMRVGDDEG